MPTYKYHPATTARLGEPLDSRNPFDDKTTGGFFKWESVQSDSDVIGADVEFSLKEVFSREELYEKMSLDLSIEAKFGLSSGKVSLNWEKEIDFSDTSIIYVFSGRKTYNPQSKNGVLEFSDKGKAFWKDCILQNNVIRFQRIVGTEIVSQIRKGNNVSVVYSFKCTSSTVKEKVRTQLQYKWATGSVDVDFSDEVKRIDEFLELNVRGFQSGVGETNMTRLSDIINVEPGKITKITQVIKEILGNVSREDRDSAPILDYSTTQISSITEIAVSKFYDAFVLAIELNSIIDSSCIQLSTALLDNVQYQDDLNSLLRSWNDADFKPGSKKVMEDKIREMNDLKTGILLQYKKCIGAQKDSDCHVQITYPVRLKYSDILVYPLIIPLNWSNSTVPYQDGFDVSSGSFITTFYPTVYIKFATGMKLVYIIKNNVREKVLTRDLILKLQQEQGSFRNIWTTIQQDLHVPVWAWHAPFVEGKRQELNAAHIARELGNSYILQIILDDGSTHEVDLGNAAKPITLPKMSFAHIPTDVVSNFEKKTNSFKLI